MSEWGWGGVAQRRMSEPLGLRAAADFLQATSGEIQWKEVAARTASNFCAGSGQFSKVLVTILTFG